MSGCSPRLPGSPRQAAQRYAFGIAELALLTAGKPAGTLLRLAPLFAQNARFPAARAAIMMEEVLRARHARLVRAASAAYRGRDYARAIALLEPLGQATPPEPPVELLRGMAHLHAGNAAAAREALNRCIEADARLPTAYLYLAYCALDAHDEHAALAALERALALQPDNVAARTLHARVKAGRFHGWRPDGIPYTRADECVFRRDHAQAFREWVTELALARRTGDVAEEIGMLLASGVHHFYYGKPRIADRRLARALKLAQAAGFQHLEAQAHFELGLVAVNRQQIADARRHFETTFTLGCTLVDQSLVATGVGWVAFMYALEGHGVDAVAMLQKMLAAAQVRGESKLAALHRKNLDMLQLQVLVLRQKEAAADGGRMRQANQALPFPPNGPFPGVQATVDEGALLSRGKREQCVRAAIQANQDGRYAEVLALLEPLGQRMPPYALVEYLRGAAYMELRQYPASRAAFERCIAGDPRNAASHFYLACVHLAQRDYAAALVTLDRVLELRPDYAPARDLHARVQAGRFYAWRPDGTFRSRGDHYARRGEHRQAFKEWARELVRARNAGDVAEEITLLIASGAHYFYYGKPARAEQRLIRALDLARNAGLQRQEAQAHFELGAITVQRREYDAAREDFERALALGRALNDPGLTATGLAWVAFALALTGRGPDGVAMLQGALVGAQARGESKLAAMHGKDLDMLQLHLLIRRQEQAAVEAGGRRRPATKMAWSIDNTAPASGTAPGDRTLLPVGSTLRRWAGLLMRLVRKAPA
jgi:tetratricopeptide (TPR) repeat protein